MLRNRAREKRTDSDLRRGLTGGRSGERFSWPAAVEPHILPEVRTTEGRMGSGRVKWSVALALRSANLKRHLWRCFR